MHFKGEGPGGRVLLGHRHVTEQDMAELEASGSAAGSILGLRPGALSVSHARASCRVAQGRPKASPACAPRGCPVASPVPASSVARLWAQGTGWARGGCYPGRGTHAGSGVRQTWIHVSGASSWVSPFAAPRLRSSPVKCGPSCADVKGTMLSTWQAL